MHGGYYDEIGYYHEPIFSFDNPETGTVRSHIPEGLSTEEKIRWLEREHDALVKDFERLCRIVKDMQYAMDKMVRYTDLRFNDTEYVLQKHTNKFHACLIIAGPKEEKEKDDESNIP